MESARLAASGHTNLHSRQQWLCQLEEKQCLLDVDGLTFWASLLGLLISQRGSSFQRVSPSYPLHLVIALHRCRKINGSSLRIRVELATNILHTMPTVLFKISVCKSACKKIYNVICIGDDSGSSESLPQPNNAAYKPVVINISNDAGPSHRRMKAKKKKKKEHTSHAPTTKSINPQDLHNPRGNKVRLYRKQLTNLRRLIATRKPHIRYYICHMSKTFATQRMYFSASFTKKYLRRCIDPKLYDLPIKSGDGNTCIKARLIKGVDNRATITRGWANFFHAANMKEREIYAFAFKRNYKRLRLTVHAL